MKNLFTPKKIFLISLVLCAFSFYIKSSPKKPMALDLNIFKNLDEIKSIQIYDETASNDENNSYDENLWIEKCEDFWFAYLYDEIYLVDEKKVNSLLNLLRKDIKMYKILDKNEEKSQFFTNSCTISVSDSASGEVMTASIKLGNISSVTGSVYIMLNADGEVYETENIFDAYRSSDINKWLCGEIFAEIKNPVENTSLTKYRHGQLTSFKADKLTFAKAASFTVIDENGRSVTANFYKYKDDYLCTKKIIPSSYDPFRLQDCFKMSENAVYEVSAWTFENIKASANKIKL